MKPLKHYTKQLITFSVFICTAFFLSVSMYSCKQEDLITAPNQAEYYNWTQISIPHDTVYDIISLNNDNLILYSSGIKKLNSEGITPITVNDTAFAFITFNAFASDYYVFGGTKRTDPQTGMIKIFDNGVYTNYFLPRQPEASIPTAAYFIGRNKFYVVIHPESKKYFLFDNGTFTEFELSEGKASEFFKASGNLYIKAISTTIGGYSYYRVNETGAQYLWSETYTNSSAADKFYLANDVIAVTYDSTKAKFSYFTEQGWQPHFTYTLYNINEFITDVAGESRDRFIAFKINLSNGASYAYAWDGRNFTGQTNFPTGITQYPYRGYFAVSNFRNNEFYMYPNYNSRMLLKVIYTGP